MDELQLPIVLAVVLAMGGDRDSSHAAISRTCQAQNSDTVGPPPRTNADSEYGKCEWPAANEESHTSFSAEDGLQPPLISSSLIW